MAVTLVGGSARTAISHDVVHENHHDGGVWRRTTASMCPSRAAGLADGSLSPRAQLSQGVCTPTASGTAVGPAPAPSVIGPPQRPRRRDDRPCVAMLRVRALEAGLGDRCGPFFAGAWAGGANRGRATGASRLCWARPDRIRMCLVVMS